MSELVKYVDVCIANEEDAKDVFGIEAEGTDIYGGQLEKYLKMGVMERKNGRIYIKPQYLYVSNNILSDFV